MKTIRKFLGFVFLSAMVSAPAFAAGSPVLLDVRTPSEFNESHLDGAANIDFLAPDFRSRVEKLDRNKSYALYCRSGNRSGKAEALMKSLGFKDVKNVGSLKDASKTLKIGCGGKPEC